MKGGVLAKYTAKTVGTIVQFRCMSSVIFLTHPTFIASNKATFVIDSIYDTNKQLLWPLEGEGTGQNITNMPMQTLHICLQLPVLFNKLMSVSNKAEYSSSFYNIIAVEQSSGDFIKDDIGKLGPNPAIGAKGKVNSKNLSDPAPPAPYVKRTKLIPTDNTVKATKKGKNTIVTVVTPS
jgi:hypothetical protein